MCGRFSITKEEEELEKRFAAKFYTEVLEKRYQVRYNVAPSQDCPVIRNNHQDRIELLRWGLIPIWAEDMKVGYKMINARKESVATRNSFKDALEKRRCLVPADGFYEWVKKGNTKIPYRITIKGGELFAFAGLWERWHNPQSGEWIKSFTIITTEPSKKIEHIHDRMPVILLQADEKKWLDSDLPVKDSLDLLHPYPDELLEYYTVSNLVNSPANDVPKVLEKVDYPVDGTLF